MDLDLAVDLNATQTEGAIHRAVIIQVHDVQVHRQANGLDAWSRPADERGSWCLRRAACPQ
jgi:dihydropteroate synthase